MCVCVCMFACMHTLMPEYGERRDTHTNREIHIENRYRKRQRQRDKRETEREGLEER